MTYYHPSLIHLLYIKFFYKPQENLLPQSLIVITMNGTISQVSIKGVYLLEKNNGPVPLVLLEDEAKRIMPIYIGLSEAI